MTAYYFLLLQVTVLVVVVLVGGGVNGLRLSTSSTSPFSRGITSLAASPRKIDIGAGDGVAFGKEMAKHSLLAANEEFLLARQYKLGVQIKAQRKLMTDELGRPVADDELAAALGLSSADQVEYLLTKGKDSKRVLVKANMRLVFHISKYYKNRGCAYPDLIQEGTFGLMKAVDKYDPDRGFRFSTYASWWIKQSVSRAIAEKSRIVRLPVHIHDLMISMSRVERTFWAQHNRKPSTEELAERLALPVHKVELLVKSARDVNSIDANVYETSSKGPSNNDVQVKDRLVSETAAPSSLNERNSVRAELRRAMQSLSEREAQIVEMRFGLVDGNQMTLEEIGKEFNVTRERIRQIESRALAKMRSPVKVEELKDIFQDQSLTHQSLIRTEPQEASPEQLAFA